ncbi:MAG: tetratricopeptide repeat protein [Bacteroidota bacterium]
MKKNWFLFVINFLICLSVFAQQNEIDSLLFLIKKDKTDTTKIIHFNHLSKEYMFIGVYDSAEYYANYALKLSNLIATKNTNNIVISETIKKCISSAYNNFGNINYEQGNYPEALKNHSIALKIREELGDQQGIATSYNNMGITFYAQGNYPEALKKYFACLKIREQSNNKSGIAAAYNNIGNIYDEQHNYPEALKNHFEALKIRRAIGEKKGESATLNNIGNVYNNQLNYDEALKNHLASLKIKLEMGDKKGIANSHNNMGNVYDNMGNYSEALKNFKISLEMRKEIGDQAGIASSYNSIGSAYLRQKNYKISKEYIDKALELSKKNRYKISLEESYLLLTDLNNEIGNYKEAFENHKLFIVYRDSINLEDTREKTIQGQMTYDFEKREAATKAEQTKKDLIATEEKQKQKFITTSVSAGLFLVLLFSLFIFRGYKQKQKANIIITQQKHIVEEQQKEIIDSIKYAKRLQQAILPSNDEITKYLPNSFLLYKPKDIVAGDFYWMENINDITFIAAADSTGHGVPGAMVSVVCSNALNRAVNEFKLFETGKILDKTRELVLETFAKSGEEIKDGMDISLLAINKKTNEINWSGANNALWYITDNDLQEIKADKQAIGKTENQKPFTTHRLNLKKETIYYLFTDGYADQFGGEKGKKFKSAKLKELLISIYEKPIDVQKEIIDTSFEAWKGKLEQVDDVCIIGIKV